MFSKFDEVSRKVLNNMKKEMSDLNHPYVGSEHLFLSILKYGDASLLNKFKRYNIDYNCFRSELIKVVGIGSKKSEYFLYTPLLKKVIENAILDSSDRGKKEVDLVDLLMSLFAEGEGIAIRIMIGLNIDLDSLISSFSDTEIKGKKNKKLLINNLGINLNDKVKSGDVDPVVGREKEVLKVIEILSRRYKNNPLLIGDAGVGKTAIVEEVARIIEEGKVNSKLYNKKIISVSMSSLVAGTKYRGEFEERIEKMIKELEDNEEIILFIDEIHTLVGAGGAEGAIDASNILKPALARGKLKLIGATTTSEFKEFIEKDKALTRRFQIVEVKEPNIDVVKDILFKLRPIYEDYHQVKINDDVINSIVNYSDKYIYNKKMPDKAIDVLDQVCSMVSSKNIDDKYMMIDVDNNLQKIKIEKNKAILRQDLKEAFKLKQREINLEMEKENYLFKNYNKNYKSITIEDVKTIIMQMSKIPILEDFDLNYDLYKKKINNLVIGQDKAVEDVLKILKSIKFKRNNKPKSLLFVGSTGVGKTLLAKEVANIYCSDNLIRLDMSEYKESHSVSKIIGSPPGYVGYDDNNNVFERVKDNPYSVILLDEIEKASSNVLNIFLQILDEGCATNSKGEVIRFDNTIIIMTSNIGYSNNHIGFNKIDNDIKRVEIENILSKELTNRIDKIIYFDNIDEISISKIIDKKIDDLKNEYKKKDIVLKIKNKVKEEIKEMSLYNVYGARKIDKIISEYIDSKVIDKAILGQKEIIIDEIKEKVV